MGRVWVGVSGWDYPDWRGPVYPAGTAGLDALRHVAARLPTVEVNRSFYRLTTPAQVRGWYAATPPGFVLSVKGSRFLTHVKRLRDPEVPLANFLAAGLLALTDKLGPLLWQLPATTAFDPDRLEAFLRLLPHDSGSAAALARRHDQRVVDAVTEPDGHHAVQHVLEPRHPSFASPAFADLVERFDVAVAVSHSARWPCFTDGAGPVVYVRLHGPDALYASGYGPAGLDEWEQRVRAWAATGRDVYVYFDNTADGLAMAEAQAFAARWPDGSAAAHV